MAIIFNTKLRRKLLSYSFAHPDEHYYVRELSALIDEDAGNLSRELRKLQEEGLYLSFVKGSAKFYSLNKKCSLFKELKQIIFKTEGAAGSLKEILKKYNGISLAFLYGSFAKNKENKSSDIDLVVAGKFPRAEFLRDIRMLESKLNREINFSSYLEEEFIKEKNKKGSFLNLIVEDKKIVLKGSLDNG